MTEQTVSWQSAFFGLAAIALNTMSQPAGRVCGFEVATRMFVRSSPLVCAVDSMQIIAQFVLGLSRGDTLRQTLKRVTDHRFEEIEAEAEDNLESLLKSTLQRWTIFGLSAATQIVKLFALGGIWWTQMCAAVYIFSWAVIEILVLMTFVEGAFHHPGSMQSGLRRQGGFEKFMFSALPGYLAVLGQCVLSVTALIAVGNSSLFENGDRLTRKGEILTKILWFPTFGIGIPLISSAFLMVIPIGLAQFFEQRSGLEIPQWTFFFTGVLLECICFGYMFRQIYWLNIVINPPKDSISLYPALAANLIGAIALLLLVLSQTQMKLSGLLMLWKFLFLLVNFFGGLSFYATHYNPVGTRKPSWTDLLG